MKKGTVTPKCDSLFFYLILSFTEMQLLLQKEADLAEYYQMLLSQNENQTILIHDIKKHLHSIAVLNENKEYDKTDAYYQIWQTKTRIRQ